MRQFIVGVILSCLMAVAVGGGPGGGPYGPGGGPGGPYGYYGGNDYYAYPRFQYSYGVSDRFTGDHKTAHEHREGGVTKGSYSVLQPDGILRIVNYVVDPIGGFQAQVLNKGLALHAPVYGGRGAVAYSGYGLPRG